MAEFLKIKMPILRKRDSEYPQWSEPGCAGAEVRSQPLNLLSCVSDMDPIYFSHHLLLPSVTLAGSKEWDSGAVPGAKPRHFNMKMPQRPVPTLPKVMSNNRI